MIIPYNKTNVILEPWELEEIKKIIETGWVANGPWTEQLENIVKEKTNVKYVIACNTCTSALILGLRALREAYSKEFQVQSALTKKEVGVKEYNRRYKLNSVSTQAFTWYSTSYAIDCNFDIDNKEFCDINPDTWLVDFSNAKYNSDILVVVDTFGNEYIPTEDDKKSSKFIVFDAAHGWGLPNLGHRGIFECVSLSFTKVTSAGQGGLILTNNENIAKICKELETTYAKMLEVNCLVALNSIKNYDDNQKKRLNIIKKYWELLKIDYIGQKVGNTNWSVFGILLENKEIRDKIYNNLKNNEIETKIYYTPLENGYKNTDNVFSRILCLPVYPLLKDDEIEFITKIINESI
jgi:dTDP-4-amino-4,6-dideoxygalactose transaminase